MKKYKKTKKFKRYTSNNLSRIKEASHFFKTVDVESEKCLCIVVYFPIFSECFYNKGSFNLKFLNCESPKLVEKYISFYIKTNRRNNTKLINK